MNLLDRIRAERENLTPGERTAAEYILQYPYDVIRFGSATLAEYAGTSRSNVVRFCKKIGFLGYAEFCYELDRTLKGIKQEPPAPAADTEGQMNVLQEYLAGFAKLEALYHSTRLQDVAARIVAARRVFVLGMDHSFFSAQQLAFRLNRAMIDATALGIQSSMQSYGGILGKRDLVILCSVQGRKDAYSEIIKTYRAWGVSLVLVTVYPHAQLAAMVDETIVLPAIAQEYSSDMLDDLPTFYLFIELLLEAVQKLPIRSATEEATE